MSKGMDELFFKALEVVNTALTTNIDKTPYRQLIEEIHPLQSGAAIGISVYRSDPKRPIVFRLIAFRNGRLVCLPDGSEKPAAVWHVSKALLQDIVEDPNRYIRHPERLELDWMRSRLGLI